MFSNVENQKNFDFIHKWKHSFQDLTTTLKNQEDITKVVNYITNINPIDETGNPSLSPEEFSHVFIERCFKNPGTQFYNLKNFGVNCPSYPWVKLKTIIVKNSDKSYSSNDLFFVRIRNSVSSCTACLDSNYNDFQYGNIDTFTNLNYQWEGSGIPGNCQDFNITRLTSFEVLRWGYGNVNLPPESRWDGEEMWLGDYILLKSDNSMIEYNCTNDNWIPADIRWHQFNCEPSYPWMKLKTIVVKNSYESYNSNDAFFVRIRNSVSSCTTSLDSSYNDFQYGHIDTFTNLNGQLTDYGNGLQLVRERGIAVPGNCQDFDITELTSFEVLRWEYGNALEMGTEMWLGDYILLKSDNSRIKYNCTNNNNWIPANQRWYKFNCRLY